MERLQRRWPDDATERPWLLPLHASLTPAEQARVFAAPPAGHRKVVLSTNVAETSITVYVCPPPPLTPPTALVCNEVGAVLIGTAILSKPLCHGCAHVGARLTPLGRPALRGRQTGRCVCD
jgi:hypothetical protein